MNKKKIIIISISLIVIIGVYLVISSGNNKVNTQANVLNNQDTTSQNKEVSSQPIDASQNDNSSVATQSTGIVINKSEITSTAKFYKYKSGNINMEVMAVKATDGSIRTALNTCQVCYDSGRGYYKQQGDYMVCQNCGNRFNLNQIEKIKGGCNPVPVLKADKTETGDTITISKEYLDSQKNFFESWKN